MAAGTCSSQPRFFSVVGLDLETNKFETIYPKTNERSIPITKEQWVEFPTDEVLVLEGREGEENSPAQAQGGAELHHASASGRAEASYLSAEAGSAEGRTALENRARKQNAAR